MPDPTNDEIEIDDPDRMLEVHLRAVIDPAELVADRQKLVSLHVERAYNRGFHTGAMLGVFLAFIVGMLLWIIGDWIRLKQAGAIP